MKKINWTNSIFFTVLPILGLVGVVLFCVFGLASWPTWILFAVLLYITGLSITGGYHRLFSHKTYKATWIVRLFFVLFGAAAFEGSVLDWCTDHRDHHRYSETDKDPYNINKGLLYAHMGWLFTLDKKKRNYYNVRDLVKDPLIRFQHKYYVWIATIMSLGFPTAVASLWGDPLSGLVLAGLFRMNILHHSTFAINSICHKFGKRKYSLQQTAVDNWFTALLTYGEGYHNFHHRFPLDYRNGIRFFDYDPTKWLIKGLNILGLAHGLKKIKSTRILYNRVQTEAKRLKIDSAQATAIKDEMKQRLVDAYEKLMGMIKKVEEYERNYIALKKEKQEKKKSERKAFIKPLSQYKRDLKLARFELKKYNLRWRQLSRRAYAYAGV